jgi:hypothetical protein
MSSPVRFSSVARSPGSTVRLAIAPDADDPMLIPSLNQVKELQDSLPRARILYLSATAASEPEQFLNYGERLRLWVRASALSLSLAVFCSQGWDECAPARADTPLFPPSLSPQHSHQDKHLQTGRQAE